MNANESFEQMFRREMQERERKTKAARGMLMAALSRAKVSKVLVDFDGSGDSGSIGDISYKPARGKENFGKGDIADTPHEVSQWTDEGCKRVVRDYTYDELVEEVCYGILGSEHPGWEINEGSFGEFEIDVAKGSVSLTFNQRVETYETSEEEY